MLADVHALRPDQTPFGSLLEAERKRGRKEALVDSESVGQQSREEFHVGLEAAARLVLRQQLQSGALDVPRQPVERRV